MEGLDVFMSTDDLADEDHVIASFQLACEFAFEIGHGIGEEEAVDFVGG